MRILYNLLLIPALILAAPMLLVKPKYRGRAAARLGFGLTEAAGGRPRIWVHALSVGEVSSARSLVKALRGAYREGMIILSTATRAGGEFARRQLASDVDLFVWFPFDLPSTVSHFLRCLDPDLFILVETDFWPNFLTALRQRGTPALLVNGRISRLSFARYSRLRWLFQPLFNSFTMLSMQTAADAGQMEALGVLGEKIRPLGNLKYDVALPAGVEGARTRQAYGLPADAPLWVAGSTHPGEEEIVLRVHRELLTTFPDLCLILAPRQIERGEEISGLAASCGLAARTRSSGSKGPEQVLVLDTIGELAAVYGLADFAFVGGSLVAAGGHNPLEPAACGRPVLYGPHMQDFSEIAHDLEVGGGARTVRSEEDLLQAAQTWLSDSERRRSSGRKALALVAQHQGATARHLELIGRMLAGKGRE
ncbi:MAG: 3-deoxy-D-manno-octulosonic acid transferase [Deltaproteobacteria bacterium]|jgi:3-deoxy-D-manno-octulosonic-acid transferase